MPKDDSYIAKKAWNHVSAEILPRGRPWITWRKTVRKETDFWNVLKIIAKNRNRWKVGVVAAL